MLPSQSKTTRIMILEEMKVLRIISQFVILSVLAITLLSCATSQTTLKRCALACRGSVLEYQDDEVSCKCQERLPK